ncbi:MAG: M15 family metallopeptidase [Alistipes sp.]|nr:M15 family metallopeptidase [Alistipes sp.]
MSRLIYIIVSLVAVITPLKVWAQRIAEIDRHMVGYGLVDIQSLDDSILVDLKYSTEDNFVGVDMYGNLERAYLEPSFAKRVVMAQRLLKERHPDLTLLIYDAARPISVQRRMREAVIGTHLEAFVADGTRGGRHNYGVAVDLTIATNDGAPLDMGAGFDEFSPASAVKDTPDTSDAATRTIKVYTDYVNSLVDSGVVSRDAAHNRILLLEVMCEAGLVPYRREWWHYEEVISISETRKRYKLLDF